MRVITPAALKARPFAGTTNHHHVKQVATIQSDTRTRLLGIAAALATIAIWGGSMVTARFGVTTTLAAYDITFLRYSVPGILFLPVLWHHRHKLHQLDWKLVALMAVGAGVPGGLISMLGMRFAPSADMAVMQPGSMPVFVALLATLFGIERMGRLRALGVGMVFLAVAGLGTWRLLETGGALWFGFGCFLTSAFLWAVYTVAHYRSGLGAMLAAALISSITAAVYAPFYFLFLEPRLMTAPVSTVLLQLVVLGVLSGAVALYTYGYAVRSLGAVGAASFTALTPVSITLFGWLVLDEQPDLQALIALGIVSIGIAMVNMAQDKARPEPSTPSRNATPLP